VPRSAQVVLDGARDFGAGDDDFLRGRFPRG
jgi:hypothetical protein